MLGTPKKPSGDLWGVQTSRKFLYQPGFLEGRQICDKIPTKSHRKSPWIYHHFSLIHGFCCSTKRGKFIGGLNRVVKTQRLLDTTSKGLISTVEFSWFGMDFGWKTVISYGDSSILRGGGFKYLLMFIPIWENDPIWRIIFKWVETTN